MQQSEFYLAGIAAAKIRSIISIPFYKGNTQWAAEAAFALLMIEMKDLLQILNKNNCRINFTDDVKIGDVTDLISTMRNAICHIGSNDRQLDASNNSLSFGVIFGKAVILKIDDLEISSDYEDDIAFCYGKYVVYLKRHIHRAFKEAEKLLSEIAEAQGWTPIHDIIANSYKPM